MVGEHASTEPGGSTHPITARGVPSGLSDQPSPLIMWMPGGIHEITASRKGQPVTIRVQVDRAAAAAVQQSLRGHLAGRQRPHLDFNHRGAEASGWPTEILWAEQPEPGIYARVEWSDAGRSAIEGRSFRAFSPSFFVDESSVPARVTGAPLNMGGLVNDPAFTQMAPLWARQSHQTNPNMEPNQAAGAAGNSNPNPTQVSAAAGGQPEAVAVVAIQDASPALQQRDADLAAVRAQNASLGEQLTAMRKRAAKSAVEAAVARGAIPAQNVEMQAQWLAQLERDPDSEALLNNIAGNPVLTAGRLTQPAPRGGAVHIAREDSRTVVRAYAAERDPRKRGAIYAADLRDRIQRDETIPIDAANTLGTTATDLVSQRVLDLLVELFPVIRRISTDLSAEAVDLRYGKTINVSLITPPTAGTYHTTNGYVSQAAVASSVPVACDRHKFVQHEFNAEELSGSSLNLFTRHAPGMAYALGLEFVTYLYGLIVKASFTTETIRTLANMDRTAVIALGTALTKRNVPQMGRTLLLNPDYTGALFEDASIVSLAAFNQPDIITRGRLPMVHGFEPFEAPSLPTAENLVGFGFTSDALAMVARTPSEYATALPGVTGGGVTSTIIEPNTGLACMKVDFVDHQKGFAYSRLAWMYGAAKGQVASGQRLVSAAS